MCVYLLKQKALKKLWIALNKNAYECTMESRF